MQVRVMSYLIDQERKMTKKSALIVSALVLALATATQSTAQVKRVQMHIAGYLCGN